MKAMASRGATPPSTTEWRSRERGRAGGRAPAALWLALPGLAALGVGLPVGAATRVGLIALGLLLAASGGLIALGLLLAASGGLVARRAVGVGRDRLRTSRRSLPTHQVGVASVGGHRAGREARGRVPGARGGHERERRASLRRARPVLPTERHAWKDR